MDPEVMNDPMYPNGMDFYRGQLTVVPANDFLLFTLTDALLVFKGTEADGDQHKIKNYTIFEHWLKSSLISNRPKD